VLLSLSTTAFADDDGARHDKVTCVLEQTSGARTAFEIALKNYDDKDMGNGEEDGAQGSATAAGYKVHYATRRTVPCSAAQPSKKPKFPAPKALLAITFLTPPTKTKQARPPATKRPKAISALGFFFGFA
jgi:hypothetical protein